MTSARLEKLWEEYLSHKPSKKELTNILFGILEGEKLKEIAWESFKAGKGINREDLFKTLLYCEGSEKITSEAGEMFFTMKPRKEEMEGLIRALKLSNPISKKAREILGRGKNEILRELKELAR